MSNLKIFNTLGRKKEKFIPLNPPQVSFYQCGPTVYWIQHIGNMRAMVLADLIRRSLDYLGYQVKFARNYTDVGHLTDDEDEGQDKLEQGAKREGLAPQEIADKYIGQFESDVKALNCLEPDDKPRATDYIPQMAAMVQELIDKGLAYATDLAIYFDVSKYIGEGNDYTALSGQKLEKNISDAGKGEVGDAGKKSPADFAVWFFKAGAHENALQTWEQEFRGISQPVKEGFPGWHLECSAMNKSIFGPTVDLHMGGIEHVPVHHTNEIAQSEGASGAKFVDFWLHNEHLTVAGAKMSKSDGTAYSLDDVRARGFDPLVLRYFFLGAHYRSKQNFTWEALNGAKKSLDNLYLEIAKYFPFEYSDKELYQWIEGVKNDRSYIDWRNILVSAIEDDFNIPELLGVMNSALKSLNSPSVKMALVLNFDKIFGLRIVDSLRNINMFAKEIPAKIIELAETRQKAREEKDWAESDRLRDEMAKQGWTVDDAPTGYKIKKA